MASLSHSELSTPVTRLFDRCLTNMRQVSKVTETHLWRPDRIELITPVFISGVLNCTIQAIRLIYLLTQYFCCNYSAIIGRYRICQFIKPQIRLESHDKKFCCASWLFQRPNEVRGKRPPRSLNETCRSSSV